LMCVVNPLMDTLKLQSNGTLYCNTVIDRPTLAVDGWVVTFGTARRAAPPSPLLAVPNVAAHPSTAAAPTFYLFDVAL